MSTRTLRRTRKQVVSNLEDVIDKIGEVAGTLGDEAEKAGGEVRAEFLALPEQLEGVRRVVVAAAEPYRPPKRYRPYVQLSVLAAVLAAAIAIVVARRTAATPSDRAVVEPADTQAN